MFVVKYTQDLPQDLERHFKENSRRQFNNTKYREVKIFKKVVSNNSNLFYFSGAIYFKRKIKDFEYTVRNLDQVQVTPKDTFVAYELDFVIMKDPKIILFFSKDDASLFGINILSEVLYGTNDKLDRVVFDCTAIYKNKRREGLTDINYNGVRSNGKITAQGQWGSDIDNDEEFLDIDDRFGIGFVWDNTRITVYQKGSIIYRTNVRDFNQQMSIRKKILNKFLKYSNYQ